MVLRKLEITCKSLEIVLEWSNNMTMRKWLVLPTINWGHYYPSGTDGTGNLWHIAVSPVVNISLVMIDWNLLMEKNKLPTFGIYRESKDAHQKSRDGCQVISKHEWDKMRRKVTQKLKTTLVVYNILHLLWWQSGHGCIFS